MKRVMGGRKREKGLVAANEGGQHSLIGLNGEAPARTAKLM